MGRMVDAVKTGDRGRMLDALLMKLAETLDGTDSGRDVGALAIKFVDVLDKIAEGRPEKPLRTEQADSEVAKFEVIAKRRGDRRKAAAG